MSFSPQIFLHSYERREEHIICLFPGSSLKFFKQIFRDFVRIWVSEGAKSLNMDIIEWSELNEEQKRRDQSNSLRFYSNFTKEREWSTTTTWINTKVTRKL